MSDALACEGNGSSASAVDLSAIEQQKENIAPLAAGRSAKTLHTLFTQDRKTLNDELKAGHDRFNAEIDQVEKDGADDPLDVYHRQVTAPLSMLSASLSLLQPGMCDGPWLPTLPDPRMHLIWCRCSSELRGDSSMKNSTEPISVCLSYGYFTQNPWIALATSSAFLKAAKSAPS